MVAQSPTEPTWLTIIRLLRWDKPAGRLILMIPALWAVVLAAKGAPPLPLVGIIILGTLATSGLGCVVNDLWDRDIDPQVERTKNRPIAARALSVKVGIGIAIISLICAAILAFYLNSLSFWHNLHCTTFDNCRHGVMNFTLNGTLWAFDFYCLAVDTNFNALDDFNWFFTNT